MAGGSWNGIQNKRRPGAYFDFKAAPRQSVMIGTRGIVALPVALPWGAEGSIIKLTVDEYMTGKSVAKVGYDITDTADGAIFIREAFKGSYNALIYRINKGGTKATGTIVTGVIATAAYSGSLGNALTVRIVANGELFNIDVIYDGNIVNSQTVAEIGQYVNNEWIELNGTGTISAIAGVPLVGGTDGTKNASNYTEFLDLLSTLKWNCVAIPDETAAATIETYIRNLRDNEGRYVQAVVNEIAAPDYEGVINTKGQGVVLSDGIRIEPNTFVAWVAGISAGAQINQSNTYRIYDNAVEIINPLKNSEITEALEKGYFVVSERQDGAIVVEQDINSLTTFTENRPYDWSKNRVVRTNDDLATQIKMIFELSFIGKVDNNASGRITLKSTLINLFNQVQDINAIQDFDSTTDIIVDAGMTGDAVTADYYFKSVDSMEKLYNTLTLKA